MDINRILVPVDFSHEARFALDWAIQLLRSKSNGSIFLYHVFPPSTYLTAPMDWDVDGLEKPDIPLKKNIQNWLERIPSNIHSDFLLSQGSVTSDVSHFCKHYFIDLIVIVARGHHGLSRWIRHNTCENIVRGATCPVIVLHNKPVEVERVPTAREEYAAMLTPQL
jgi:nucleotide-binding universal stress UspA family protein